MSALQSNLLELHTPNGREEAWRFTPLKRLAGMHDGSAQAIELDSLQPVADLPQGVTFTTVEAEALSSTDDIIINRIRAFTGNVRQLILTYLWRNLCRLNGVCTHAYLHTKLAILLELVRC